MQTPGNSSCFPLAHLQGCTGLASTNSPEQPSPRFASRRFPWCTDSSLLLSAASSDAPKADPGRSAHILLVDHDESVLEAVSTFLRGRDHRVQSARNMQEARGVLEQQNFDVIIADLQIAEGPNGSGLENWLAQNKPALLRKLIWMCAVAPSEGAADRVGDNNSRILQKPFKVSELLAAVDELLLNRMDAAPIGR